MSVSHEVKGQLAKLLATEDLVVENKKVPTASFNVHTRVLTLPMWDKASNTVYDMLVAHEVGHALFTPDINWYKEHKVHPSIVNIVEDVRIEKMMKRKYPGLPKTFYHAYEELHDDDFFSIFEEDITQFSFADRVNLHFKIGLFTAISFTDEEEVIVDRVASCETFDEVLEVSKLVQQHDEELKKIADMEGQEQVKISVDVKSGDKSESKSDTTVETDEEQEYKTKSEGQSTDTEESKSDEQSEETEEQTTSRSGGGDIGGDPNIRTVQSFEENIEDLTDYESCRDNVYVELPKIDLSKILVDGEEIQKKCEEWWTFDNEEAEAFYKQYGWYNRRPCDFTEVDQDYEQFKLSARKEVNYLVKEFEMKKSASAYARAATSKTGVLDTSKLHTFKFNEDLFKKVTVLPDGKNHGLMFILDWSGSMNHIMLDTIKQLYNLIWFCKKVQIPFEVYAFSNDYPKETVDGCRQRPYKPEAGLVAVQEHFSLLNFFSHKTNTKVLDTQMKYIYRIALACRTYGEYDIPQCLRLSGTPLNETLIALHELLPKFKKETKVDKVQCVVLTDGEGCQLAYHREVERSWDPDDSFYLGTSNINSSCFLRDRKLGRTYHFSGGWSGQTTVFLNHLRDRFTDINFIGIRLIAGRDIGYFLRQHIGYGDDYEKHSRIFRKEKSLALEDVGYNVYFGLSAKSLANDSEFQVQDDATKAQIKRAFVKSLSAKKFNKKVLSKFMEFVA